jgi:hypothetical protein
VDRRSAAAQRPRRRIELEVPTERDAVGSAAPAPPARVHRGETSGAGRELGLVQRPGDGIVEPEAESVETLVARSRAVDQEQAGVTGPAPQRGQPLDPVGVDRRREHDDHVRPASTHGGHQRFGPVIGERRCPERPGDLVGVDPVVDDQPMRSLVGRCARRLCGVGGIFHGGVGDVGHGGGVRHRRPCLGVGSGDADGHGRHDETPPSTGH